MDYVTISGLYPDVSVKKGVPMGCLFVGNAMSGSAWGSAAEQCMPYAVTVK